MAHLLYLHGFGSSPDSSKARVFRERLAGAGVELAVPLLAPGGFGGQTLSGQLRVVEEATGGSPVSLIGSSLGGYLAALYAARHGNVEKLVLLAPAFGFARRWAESLGAERMADWRQSGCMEVMNHTTGKMEELGWQFMQDAMQFEEEPPIETPCLIYHGLRDNVVPVEASRSFAHRYACVELREVDSDHQLLDKVDEIFEGVRRFLLS